MLEKLHIYQFKKYPLIQLTDGRKPFTLADNAAGWDYRGCVAASAEGVAEFAAIAASSILGEIKNKGWCQLANFEIVEAWRHRWVDPQ